MKALKKFGVMRLAAVLLVVVLLTTTAISGTFAKYVSKEGYMEDARVAQFGITLGAGNPFFATSYLKAEANTAGSASDLRADLSIVSNNGDKVLAPGSKGGAVDLKVEGTAEVNVKIAVVSALKLENWEVNGVFYCPIVFTIGDTKYCGLDYASAGEFIDVIVPAVEAALVGLIGGTELEVPANVEIANAGTVTLTWEWAIDFDALNGIMGTTYVDGNALTAAGKAFADRLGATLDKYGYNEKTFATDFATFVETFTTDYDAAIKQALVDYANENDYVLDSQAADLIAALTDDSTEFEGLKNQSLAGDTIAAVVDAAVALLGSAGDADAYRIALAKAINAEYNLTGTNAVNTKTTTEGNVNAGAVRAKVLASAEAARYDDMTNVINDFDTALGKQSATGNAATIEVEFGISVEQQD